MSDFGKNSNSPKNLNCLSLSMENYKQVDILTTDLSVSEASSTLSSSSSSEDSEMRSLSGWEFFDEAYNFRFEHFWKLIFDAI